MTQKQYVTLHLLLSTDVDASMRALICRRGDIRDLVMEMFGSVDLRTVDVYKQTVDFDTAKATTVRVPGQARTVLKRAAKARKCSMNALMNSGIRLFVEQKQAKVSAGEEVNKEG